MDDELNEIELPGVTKIIVIIIIVVILCIIISHVILPYPAITEYELLHNRN